MKIYIQNFENKVATVKIGKENNPTTGIETLKKMVTMAPTDAPDEIPNVYGSASGFLKSP